MIKFNKSYKVNSSRGKGVNMDEAIERPPGGLCQGIQDGGSNKSNCPNTYGSGC